MNRASAAGGRLLSPSYPGFIGLTGDLAVRSAHDITGQFCSSSLERRARQCLSWWISWEWHRLWRSRLACYTQRPSSVFRTNNLCFA